MLEHFPQGVTFSFSAGMLIGFRLRDLLLESFLHLSCATRFMLVNCCGLCASIHNVYFCAGDMLSMLDVLRAAQSYDITLMLFLLPHVLLGVIISQPAASNTKDARKQGSKAPPNLVHEAIVQEVLAVARLCSTGCSLDDATAASSQPQAALHLQAFLGALDALQRCASITFQMFQSSRPVLLEQTEILKCVTRGCTVARSGMLTGMSDACSWLHDSKEKLALSKSSEPGVEQLRLQVGQMAEFCNLLYTKKDPGNGGASVLEMLAFASFRCGALCFPFCNE